MAVFRLFQNDRNDNIWFAGNDGLWCYDHNKLTNFNTNFVGYIYEDKKGILWTSSAAANGMQEWVLSRYDTLPLANGMMTATPIRTEENMFFGILEDAAGGIWLGSVKGVGRFDGERFEYFRGE